MGTGGAWLAVVLLVGAPVGLAVLLSVAYIVAMAFVFSSRGPEGKRHKMSENSPGSDRGPKPSPRARAVFWVALVVVGALGGIFVALVFYR